MASNSDLNTQIEFYLEQEALKAQEISVLR